MAISEHEGVQEGYKEARRSLGVKKFVHWGDHAASGTHPLLTLGVSKEELRTGIYRRDFNWVDHFHRLRYPNGVTVFVTEPYHLDEGALIDLVILANAGWDVYVRGMPEWHPHCVRIEISNKSLLGTTDEG